MKNIVYNIDDIDHISSVLINSITSNIVCLIGNLGSGKTTLVNNLLKKLGAIDKGSSPTFGIINEYIDQEGSLIAYHMDCYRLESPEEALDIGIEEYLQAKCWIFIEWPEKINELLPSERTEVYLRIVDAKTRELTIRNHQE